MGCVISKVGETWVYDNSESWGGLITCEAVGLLVGKFKCLMTYVYINIKKVWIVAVEK